MSTPTCSVIGCPNSGDRNPNVFYVSMSRSNKSHVAWLQQNVKQNIIALDDVITICQLHLDFGLPPRPDQQSQPPEPTRATATKPIQHDTKTLKNLNVPSLPESQNSKLYELLNKPGTSKRPTTYAHGDEQTVQDIEQYYRHPDIDRQVIDIETLASARVVKKRKVAQEQPNVSEEVQVISDDDDEPLIEIQTTETFPVILEEIVDDQTRSGDDDGHDQNTDDETILVDGNSMSMTNDELDIEPASKEEHDFNDNNEEEMILQDINILANDPLKVDFELIKEEPEDGTADLEDGVAEFEEELVEYEHIKTESPENIIDIGETVIQASSTANNELDNIFSILVEKNLITVEDRNHLSTIIFDTDCILNKKYIYNDKLKFFAEQLYFCSEKAYNFIMINYIPCLPLVERIREAFITSNGRPGFSREALNCLKMKIKSSKSAKIMSCTVAINDIELKTSKMREHKVAFIISAVAINASWKLPIGYFISSDLMNPKKRKQMVLLAISLIEATGVIPQAVIYLPIYQNIEMAENLVKNNINKKAFSALTGRMIYLIPDPVYVLDKFRICGCEDKDRAFISLRHVELLVKHLGKVRPGKVTNRLLGKSLTYSLEVCADDFLSSGLANVYGTVRYLKLINKFLDVMTSHPGGTSWKEVVNGKNVNKVSTFLGIFQEYLAKISPKYKSNAYWVNNSGKGPLKFDIKNVMDLLSLAAYGVQSVINKLTREFSRMTIEFSIKKFTMNSMAFLTNFYHVVDNGELKEMTVDEFIARYKQNLRYMKPHPAKKGCILPIENISALDITSPVQRINVTTYLLNSNNVTKNNQFEIDTRDDLYKIIRFDWRSEYSNLSKIYIAGYVVYNLVRRLRCDTCISALVRSNQRQDIDPYNTEIVIKKIEKDSSSKLCVKLMDPSVDVVRICKATDDVFRRALAQSEAENIDILERFSIPRLMLKVKKDMIGKNYLKNLDFHRHDTDTLENHVVELAKAVAEVYLQVRLKYRHL